MVYSLIRAFFGELSGRECRRCSVSIDRHDAFGLSEGVCEPCRA